ncbi:uncharacterized protein EHS24_007239 [Apiotrichum porosum]|uniref:Uncharacterized protein n=1 Tax=Apiotrichum porosum TaxID=105984 RepID=A0A427XXK7_9TREE|nr:uncharacterized protein EHS24_007239 [Apiotrichum porosum]RSH83551.1 hypothetical protein EHS24_007239 [Apiotrichum porosum]
MTVTSMFKKLKAKTGTSPTNTTSALSGMQFRGASSGGAAAKPGTTARPSWNTSLNPDPKSSGATPFPARDGIAFLDARVVLAPPKELGYLLVALGKAKIRPVLVPAVMKVAGGILKGRGGTGVLGDRQLLEAHFKAALEAVKAPDDIIADLNPVLSMSWLEENKYALPDDVESGMWLALVNGVDEKPNEQPAAIVRQSSALGKAAPKQAPEVLKQASDRLSITGEVVTVCRNTLGPHLLLTGDRVLEKSAVEDLGGPDLGAITFEMSSASSNLPFKSAADADALIRKLLEQVKAAVAAAQASPQSEKVSTSFGGVQWGGGAAVPSGPRDDELGPMGEEL